MAQSDNKAALPGFMPGRLPENAPAADFDAVAVAKALLRVTRAGTLGTIDRNTGHPFGSLVNVATDVDGSPLILISRLATHTANLEKDGRAYVMQLSILSERETLKQLESRGLDSRVVDFSFFEFTPVFDEHSEQIRRVEELSDAYHLRFGEVNTMIAYLLEITRKNGTAPRERRVAS